MSTSWAKKKDKGSVQEQGSQAWHDFRAKHIGASDVPAVMGTSDFKDPFKLWLEKTGQAEKFKGNWATRRGQKFEPVILEAYEKKYNVKSNCPESVKECEEEHLEFMSASLDGYVESPERHPIILEIKYPSEKKHQMAINGEVPSTYRDQLQAQMIVFGVSHAHYISAQYLGDDSDPNPDPDKIDLAVVPVKANPERQEEIKKECWDFWNNHVLEKVPPDCGEQQIEDQDLEATIQAYMLARENEASYKASKEELKKQIIAKMPGNKIICGDFKASLSQKKGNVDYSKIPELKGVDLDKYRKSPTSMFTIKELKK